MKKYTAFVYIVKTVHHSQFYRQNFGYFGNNNAVFRRSENSLCDLYTKMRVYFIKIYTVKCILMRDFADLSTLVNA